MHPAGDINALRVNRIGGDALHAHEIIVGGPVHQRHPHPGLVVPLVGAADIGAAIGKARLGCAEDKPVNESPALDDDRFPSVPLGGYGGGLGISNSRQQGEAKAGHEDFQRRQWVDFHIKCLLVSPAVVR